MPTQSRLLIAAITGLLILAGLVWTLASPGTNLPTLSPASGSEPGGPFTLTDHTGKQVTEKTYSDGYKLVFFGFTSCPMICPTELSKMTRTLKLLGPDGDRLRPLFITVDPERDTPEAMKSYLSAFDPRITGLTGTKEQIDAAKAAYKVFAAKVKDASSTEYTLDHSSFTFLMSPDDTLLAIYKSSDSAQAMAESIRTHLAPETP